MGIVIDLNISVHIGVNKGVNIEVNLGVDMVVNVGINMFVRMLHNISKLVCLQRHGCLYLCKHLYKHRCKHGCIYCCKYLSKHGNADVNMLVRKQKYNMRCKH